MKTDLWSVGVLTYELISGHTPFQNKNFNSTVEKIINEEVNFT